MASTGIQSAPSTSTSSSSPHRRKYDLFLSFRGKDARYEFADTLFTTLKRWGIIVFRDDEELKRGEEINPGLEVAIKESRNAAIIVSPDFTKSKACLFELTVIMECWRMGRLSVFPVFYHIDPSDVGKLTKEFESHFSELKDDKDSKAKWEYWKSLLDKIADWSIDPKLDEDLVESGGSALKKLSDISAWVVRENSYINPIIDKICQAIWAKTISDVPNISENLVGIESRAANVMQLLELEKEDEVHVVGICGMGGIGKSTLAEFIYKKIFPHFKAGHFSNSIGKEKDRGYLASVQKEIISGILPEAATNLSNNTFMVEQVFQTKLRERKVLVVLDDLWDNLQVKQLVGDLKWFGPGSRIIITSRIHDLLHLKDKNIYEVEELNKYDALELFCMKAFKQPHWKEGFEELCDYIVCYAQGHPLALEIFGSFLSNKETKDRWHGYLKDLGTKLEDNIADTLQKSLKELDKGIISLGQVFPLKELFLDIACFFNGHLKDNVLYILEGVEGFGDNLTHYLSVLEEKSLLKISNDQKLVMHDFLVDLGRQIAGSSRLLQWKDIVRVLESPSTENSQVKGIVLKFYSGTRRTFQLEALSTMVDLRVLQIKFHLHPHVSYDEMEDRMRRHGDFSRIKWIGDHTKFKLSANLSIMEDMMPSSGDFTRINWIGNLSRLKLSANLRIMEWEHYPLPYLPRGSNFAPTNLVVLNLSFSLINQLWDGKKTFPKLRHINLWHCRELIEIPDMSQVLNLEILDLGECQRLSLVHSSVGDLKRLKNLSVLSCNRLEQLPDVIHSECLEVLDCSDCPRLKKFPKLPLSLLNLSLVDCSSLEEVFYSQMTEQISKEMLRSSGCSFMVAYIGFEGKPYTILYLHPQNILFTRYTYSFQSIYYIIRSAVACGPTREPRITDWFVHKSSNSGKEIQIPLDWNPKSKPRVCALLIVYEVDGLENSDIGGSTDNTSICPEFVFQLQLKEASPKYAFVVRVPEVACVGSHGLWVCINSDSNSNSESYDFFYDDSESVKWSCQVSITASSKNVLLKEVGARLLNRDANLELVEVLTTISQPNWDSRSLDLFLNYHLRVEGPVKGSHPFHFAMPPNSRVLTASERGKKKTEKKEKTMANKVE